ncbi:hypothetical protein Agsp01_27730 [Agromyces sp. NBRC 114283]|nr:hypothetical protein Agsp01_27730 [Agromyces sp. NBRC 114283]
MLDLGRRTGSELQGPHRGILIGGEFHHSRHELGADPLERGVRQRVETKRRQRSPGALRLRGWKDEQHYEAMNASAASTFSPSERTESIVTRGRAADGPFQAA